MVRVSREKLIELAHDESERRGQNEDVISGYLIGSVASGDPMIDGTADIDLVLIHQHEPSRSREFIPLSEKIHLDITHHNSDLYNHPPDLRIHPWLGPSMCEPIFLYDPDHFFERAQAGVRGQFFQIAYVQARATAFLERARGFKSKLEADGSWTSNYAYSILESVNALATLGGFPVAGRRMAISLQDRLQEMGFEGHYFAFHNLLGADLISKDQFPAWLTAWEEAFNTAGRMHPSFNPTRRNYFASAFRNQLNSEKPETILWNLITTWNQAVETVESGGEVPPFDMVWKDALVQLKLSPEFRDARNAELEHHLDNIEEIVENWA